MKKNKSDRTIVQNCNFTGIHWDKTTLDVIQTVASGLLNLTTLFKSQNITIDSMLKIGDKPSSEGKNQ